MWIFILTTFLYLGEVERVDIHFHDLSVHGGGGTLSGSVHIFDGGLMCPVLAFVNLSNQEWSS